MVEISWQRDDGFVLVAAPSPWPPVGVAPAAAAESLRTALLQGFAEHAGAVVCDLASGPVDGAADVVTGVARRVSQWPGALLVVVTADRYARARLDSVAAGAGLRLAADRGQAAGLVRARPAVRQACQRLEPALRAPSVARAFLRETLAAWGGMAPVDEALVVADELVTNAVLHAGTEMELRLALLGTSLGIGVADRSPRRPALGRPGEGAESGRGLLLVDALAETWQVLPRRSGGKIIRAVLRPPSAAARIPAPVSGELRA